MTDLNTLAEKIKEELENPSGGEFTEEDKQNIQQAFTSILERHLNPVERTGEATLSPSTLGKCTRQLAYKFHGIKGEEFTAKQRMTFLFGDLVEAAVYFIADRAGVPIENQQARVDVDGIKGSTDGSFAGEALDVKSMSAASYSISERNGTIDDSFGYQTQLEIYKEGMGLGDKLGGWLCVNKNTGEIMALPNEPKPYLVDVAKKKREIVMASTPDNLPARDYDAEDWNAGNKTKPNWRKRLRMQCKFCSHKGLCWNVTEIVKGYNNSEIHYVD